MVAFARHSSDPVRWLGDSTCQHGHDSILAWLRANYPLFLTDPNRFTTRIQGNLGECMAFCIGHFLEFTDERPFAMNALAPLDDISRPEIDIVWIHFDADDPANDFVILQEVKTTLDPDLVITSRLVDDYTKLFGTNIRLTAHTRMRHIKNILDTTVGRPDLSSRVSGLVGRSPVASGKVKLLPTIVHERNGVDPTQRMLAVQTALVAKGWDRSQIDTWSISLSDLGERLVRLALGSA